MDILFQAARRPKTNSSPITPSAPTAISRVPKTFPFELPPGFPLTPLEASVLFYLKDHPGVDYEKWPGDVKVPRTVENMRRKRYIRRKYEPTRYFLTREGTGLVTWLNRLLEHHTEAQG